MSDTPFTVEVNHRFDPLDKAWQSHIFIKLYTAALDTGFLTAISDRDWKTLCVIALHMDEAGRCFPALPTIARALGVNKSTASNRIQSLLQFRWKGHPVVLATRERRRDGTLGRQVYTILPLTPLRFGSGSALVGAIEPRADPAEPPSSGNPELVRGSTSSGKGELASASSGLAKLDQAKLGKAERKNKIPDQQEPDILADPSDLAAPEAGTKPVINPADDLARYLKDRLRAQGMRTFPRDWHLKARSKANTLLKAGLSPVDAKSVIDWCLVHPFWHDKVRSMDKVADLVGQWQQQQGGSGHGDHLSETAQAGRHADRHSLDALVVRSGPGAV